MNVRLSFYETVVEKVIANKHATVLICGGGPNDASVFKNLGYTNVTVSNLDERMQGDEYLPYKWQFENAEQLSYKDGSFDYVVTHAAIHHASSPHRMVTEMYRVAAKGMLAFESRDSFTMRFLERTNMTQTYEHAAVYYNDCKFGGVNNTEIPNYIYRWTEREIEKTIRSYAPHVKNKFSYWYHAAFPCTPELEKNGGMKYLLLKIAKPFFFLFTKLFPKQQNQFAFYVEKADPAVALFPWLTMDRSTKEIHFNRDWAAKLYK